MAIKQKQTGLPLIKFKYDTIYILILSVIILHLCSISYSFILFSIAINIKTNLGDYLSMVTNDGFLLAFLIAMPPLIIMVLDSTCIFFLIKIIYNSQVKKKNLNQMLFIMSMLCFGSALIAFIFSVVALSHSHTKHEKLHDGIRDAMDNYSLDSTVKTQLDSMQIMFQCCGSKSYTEWYEIRWFDVNFIDNSTKLFGGEVPFSCCSMHSINPCIHHGIENTKSVYFYNPDTNVSISTHGCHEVLVKRKMSTSWSIFGFLFISIILQIILGLGMRLIQTAHSEFGKIDDLRHVYKMWLITKNVKLKIKRPKSDDVKEHNDADDGGNDG